MSRCHLPQGWGCFPAFVYFACSLALRKANWSFMKWEQQLPEISTSTVKVVKEASFNLGI